MHFPLIYHTDIRTPGRDRFRIGADDALILPIVVIAFLATTLLQTVLSIMVFASAFAFDLFLRIVTSLLLVAATAGDGLAWLIKRLADLPQPSERKRKAFRDLVDRCWFRARQWLNLKIVAETRQSLLQRGAASVAQGFEGLSPRAAMLSIVAATLWLPLSAAISLAMHAALLANAVLLPAWAQLLHPVATIIAKSKLLVLPVYSAAWPQAKNDAWVQAALPHVDRLLALGGIRKTAHRYQQTKQVFAQATDFALRAMMKSIEF